MTGTSQRESLTAYNFTFISNNFETFQLKVRHYQKW